MDVFEKQDTHVGVLQRKDWSACSGVGCRAEGSCPQSQVEGLQAGRKRVAKRTLVDKS